MYTNRKLYNIIVVSTHTEGLFGHSEMEITEDTSCDFHIVFPMFFWKVEHNLTQLTPSKQLNPK